jgi:hypothetical protein
MKRFWWIVREPVWITLGAAGWIGLAVLCGKRWGGWGVILYVLGQFLVGFAGLLMLAVFGWYQERGEEYDKLQRWAKQDQIEER